MPVRNRRTNSEWLTCRVEATRGDKRHVSQAADPTGVIVASKSIDDGAIEDDDVDVGLVCRYEAISSLNDYDYTG